MIMQFHYNVFVCTIKFTYSIQLTLTILTISIHLGMTASAGLCEAGFFCVAASTQINQEICPVGFYCEEGTSGPVACPAGTFSNTLGLTAVDDCTECTEGQYCDDTQLTAPVAECTAG